MLHLFVKVVKWIVILVIGSLLLFCILFALLQSKWAKEQVRAKITAYLKEAGITATLTELSGQLPFTWTIQEVDLELGEAHRLLLSHIQLRFAIFPLIRGQIAINYLNVEEGHYTFPPEYAPSTLLTEQGLPFKVSIQHFSINKMHVGTLLFAVEGSARATPHFQDFACDIKVLSPEAGQNYLELLCTGGRDPKAKSLSIQNFSLSSKQILLQGAAKLPSDLTKSTAQLTFTLPDLSLLPFPLSGSAHGQVDFQEGKFEASLETKALVVDTFAAGVVTTHIQGTLDKEVCRADVTCTSGDAAIPFESRFSLKYVPQTLLSCTDLHLQAPDITLSGFFDYTLKEALWNGSLSANISSLSQLSKEALHGSLDAEVTFSSKEKEQNATCILMAKNMRYKEVLLDAFNCSAEIQDLFSAPKGKCNILAQRLYTPSFYLDRLNFGARSNETNWPFYLDCKGRVEGPLECYAEGSLQKESSCLTLALTQLVGELSEIPFALRSACQLEWGAHFLNLTPLDLHIGKGRLSATFALSPTQSQCKWELQHFPLEILGVLRPRFGLNGFVTSSGFIDAKPGQLQGALNAVLEEAGVLHYGKKEPLQAKGSCQIHFNQNRAQAHIDLRATDQQFLDCSATLPITCSLYPFKIALDPTQNTSAELVAEGKLQDLFDFVNLGTNHFTGLLSCRLFLSQTLGAPSLQGELQLQDGSYENYFTGINLRHIDAQFEARHDQIHLTHLTAEDDATGHVSATGKIDLQPQKQFPYAFTAEMQRLRAVNFDMIDCALTGPVYLTGDIHTLSAQGNLLIDAATVHIAQRLPYEIPSLPVTYVNRPPHLLSKPLTNIPGFTFQIDLELTSEGRVLVTGKGLNAELEGHIHLHGTNTDIAASGTLKLITGEYLFSGKIFKLTEGEIVFNDKPTPSAHLNISGTLSLPDMTITVMLRGPLTSPQLTFQSNPQKPTSSILARILFNKDITEINHPEAIQLASTLVSLSGGAGPDVLESIRSSIGVDRLSISSTPGSDELAVQIGKYLTRGVLITLSQSATSSQVIVEVELPKGFVFQAETQEQEEGKFSLKWRRSY